MTTADAFPAKQGMHHPGVTFGYKRKGAVIQRVTLAWAAAAGWQPHPPPFQCLIIVGRWDTLKPEVGDALQTRDALPTEQTSKYFDCQPVGLLCCLQNMNPGVKC
jgi:hypothetical protein